MAKLTFISNASPPPSSSSPPPANFLFNGIQKLKAPTILSFPSRNLTQNPIPQLVRQNRGLSVITRAGPSSTSYIFAFVFPLTLLAVTIFSSIKIADQLDEKFLEELAVNDAILEEEGGDADGSSSEEEPAVPHTRNRPKREVELAVNDAILEEEGGDADGSSSEEEPAVPHTRNRPKREVEVSS